MIQAQLEPGVEGLVHVTELSWTKRIAKPSDVLKHAMLIPGKKSKPSPRQGVRWAGSTAKNRNFARCSPVPQARDQSTGPRQREIPPGSKASELVAREKNDYDPPMKTLTVQEASQGLSDWLRRAVRGEQIAIHEGNFTVLLQPLPSPQAGKGKRLSPREALGELQSQSRLTLEAAEKYLRELRHERLADGGPNRQ